MHADADDDDDVDAAGVDAEDEAADDDDESTGPGFDSTPDLINSDSIMDLWSVRWCGRRVTSAAALLASSAVLGLQYIRIKNYMYIYKKDMI